MSTAFPDHFSGHADQYARYRPHYPDDLYAWIARNAPATRQCWDVATGSGQAARALVRYFDAVIATDASPEQLSYATPQPGVTFRQALAEQSGLPNNSADAIVAAAALHWFDLPRFFAEVQRVARPGALFVAWTYAASQHLAGHPQPDFLQRFVSETLGPHWPPQFATVLSQYRHIAFPFEKLPTPTFYAREVWTLEQFVGHIQTWSGYVRARQATGEEPIRHIEEPLRRWWKARVHEYGQHDTPDGPLPVTWELTVRAGRVSAAM